MREILFRGKNNDRNEKIKKAYSDILSICEKYNEDIPEFHEIHHFIKQAKSHLMVVEWEEKYGIKIDYSNELYYKDYIPINKFMTILFFLEGSGRHISWEDNSKQPHNEWLLQLVFPTGAYIFGDDYPVLLFKEFWDELKKYKPDFIDTVNHCLYWRLENAKNIFCNFDKIYYKYQKINEVDKKKREIERKKKEIAKLKKEVVRWTS